MSRRPEALLDEPLKLLRIVRTAVVGGPGVTDGEPVKLEHVHDPDLSDGTTEEIGPLVHTRAWNTHTEENTHHSFPTVQAAGSHTHS